MIDALIREKVEELSILTHAAIEGNNIEILSRSNSIATVAIVAKLEYILSTRFWSVVVRETDPQKE